MTNVLEFTSVLMKKNRMQKKVSKKTKTSKSRRWTIHFAALFCALNKLKGKTFEDEFEFNLEFARYHQILMIYSIVSDHPLDQKLSVNFIDVPCMFEAIIKKRNPYDKNENLFLVFEYIRLHYPLPEFQNSLIKTSNELLRKAPKKLRPVVNDILEYYTTPILGVALTHKVILSEFSLLRNS